MKLSKSHKDALKEIVDAVSEVSGITVSYVEYAIYNDMYKIWLQTNDNGNIRYTPLLIKESELDSNPLDDIKEDCIALVKTI